VFSAARSASASRPPAGASNPKTSRPFRTALTAVAVSSANVAAPGSAQVKRISVRDRTEAAASGFRSMKTS
jgi:hypothetical protein